jgi:hypothetical protein
MFTQLLLTNEIPRPQERNRCSRQCKISP